MLIYDQRFNRLFDPYRNYQLPDFVRVEPDEAPKHPSLDYGEGRDGIKAMFVRKSCYRDRQERIDFK